MSEDERDIDVELDDGDLGGMDDEGGWVVEIEVVVDVVDDDSGGL